MALNERDTNESGNVSILLELMPQQHGIRHPEDDWTGLSNPVERRKLQNRIHQRAYSKYCYWPSGSEATNRLQWILDLYGF